jgi:hypothetical protein
MQCNHCQTDLPPDAEVCPACGTPVPNPTNLQIDQRARDVEGDVTGLVADDAAARGGLDAGVTQDVGTVHEGGTLTGAVLGGQSSRTHIGGTEHHGDRTEVQTEGGAYVDGDVRVTGGDVVGRDQVVPDPTASGHPDDEAELARIFAAIYQQIEARPPEPDVDKDALVEAVRQIEHEAVHGADADPREIKRWLQSLAVMAPDIVAATVSGLAGSSSGIRAVIREITQKTKSES